MLSRCSTWSIAWRRTSWTEASDVASSSGRRSVSKPARSARARISGQSEETMVWVRRLAARTWEQGMAVEGLAWGEGGGGVGGGRGWGGVRGTGGSEGIAVRGGVDVGVFMLGFCDVGLGG